MNKFICILFILSIAAQEHEIKQPKPHRHHNKSPEIHLTIDLPDRPERPEPYNSPEEGKIQEANQNLELLKEKHRHELRSAKIKISAVTVIVTALISGAVVLLIHYTSGSCTT